jgi:hypothetical protein
METRRYCNFLNDHFLQYVILLTIYIFSLSYGFFSKINRQRRSCEIKPNLHHRYKSYNNFIEGSIKNSDNKFRFLESEEKSDFRGKIDKLSNILRILMNRFS